MLQLTVDREGVLKFLGKTSSEVEKDVRHLKEWMKFQHHLPALEDYLIENLLLCSKFSLEKTKTRIDSRFSLKRYFPEIFDTRDPLSRVMTQALQVHCNVILPNYTKNFERVVITKLSTSDAKLYSWVGDFKLRLACLDLRAKYDYSNGTMVIVDLENCTLGHLKKLSPTDLKKLEFICKAYGYQLNSVHFINGGSLFDLIFGMIKLVAKPKVIARINNHQSIESLYKHIPKEDLPSDYGGNQPSMKELSDRLKRAVLDHRDFYLKDEKLYSDESKRPPTTKNESFVSLIGLDGSFRKLEID